MKTREAVLTALETQAVISKPRPNPRIRRFLTTVHTASCRTRSSTRSDDAAGRSIPRGRARPPPAQPAQSLAPPRTVPAQYFGAAPSLPLPALSAAQEPISPCVASGGACCTEKTGSAPQNGSTATTPSLGRALGARAPGIAVHPRSARHASRSSRSPACGESAATERIARSGEIGKHAVYGVLTHGSYPMITR